MRLYVGLLVTSCLMSSSLIAFQKKTKKQPPPVPHNNAFVSGEFLYLRPEQTGMTYCLKSNDAPTLPLTSFVTGDNKEVQQVSKWRPGFRVGAGFSFLQARAALAAYWTHYHHTIGDSVTAPLMLAGQLFNTSLGPFIIGGTDVPGATSAIAASRWKLHFDQIELDLSYKLKFRNRLMLIPYLGVQAGRIHQKQTINYTNFIDSLTTASLDAVINQTDRFRGIGPKFGMKGEFCLGSGFGFMGHAATFFLYGRMHAPVQWQVTGDAGAFLPPDGTIHYLQHQIMPAIQVQAEIVWERQFTRRCNLLLGVGYEIQYFWNTWRNQNSGFQNLFVSDTGYGNLAMQGGTARIVVGF